MLFLYPEVLYRSFGSPITLCWMNHIGTASTQKSLHLCSLCLQLCLLEGTTVCLGIPLQSPPPPPGDRHLVTVSPPHHPGDRRVLPGEIARGGRGWLDFLVRIVVGIQISHEWLRPTTHDHLRLHLPETCDSPVATPASTWRMRPEGTKQEPNVMPNECNERS